ncbi:ABC transporter permease subunit [Microbacteriaceae bacterium K1510]|nr:ABC transporter permease subunit [Microbacteriaceae bacterium K1510]
MRSAATKSSMPARLVADAAVIAAIVAWWLASRNLPAFVLPSPWATAQALLRFFTEPKLMVDVAATGIRVVLSVVAATALGIALAMLAYFLPVTRDIVRARILPFLNAMPSLGWAILAVIWFGVSDAAVVFAQTAILVPFCFINVSQGIDEIDTELVEMARSFTRQRWLAFRTVLIPAVAPYVVVAARLAYGVSWKIALIAELFGSERGLGYAMYQAQTVADPATVIAICLIIVLVFVLGDLFVLRPLYRWASPQDRDKPLPGI